MPPLVHSGPNVPLGTLVGDAPPWENAWASGALPRWEDVPQAFFAFGSFAWPPGGAQGTLPTPPPNFSKCGSDLRIVPPGEHLRQQQRHSLLPDPCLPPRFLDALS